MYVAGERLRGGEPQASARPISLRVKGTTHRLDVTTDKPLLFILRTDLAFNGPKYACGLGECGACTVHVDGVAARSCCIPAGIVGGREITTLERIGHGGDAASGSCGPYRQTKRAMRLLPYGMIMTVAALLRRDPHPTETAIAQALRYNLCRCGTHVEIMRAAVPAAAAAP
jgi:nicotinate dehydrogenase subunit A